MILGVLKMEERWINYLKEIFINEYLYDEKEIHIDKIIHLNRHKNIKFDILIEKITFLLLLLS